MKILISEDDEVSRILLERLLCKMGHDVISTNNGLEGLRAFNENEIDMAILDWMMPEMDGIELCMKIRELEEGTDTPIFIFMVTAKSDSKDMLQALSSGVDDFLTKPVDKKLLEQRIIMGLKYQNFLKSQKESAQEPFIMLTEEHNHFRSLIHILDVICDQLDSGVPDRILNWAISTLVELTLNIHQDKEELYFQSFINSITSEHVDWFSDISESSFVVITEEHDAIESQLMDLQGQYSRFCLDEVSTIPLLRASIKDYTGLMLRHMYREEKMFYPFAQKYISDDDSMELIKGFDDIDARSSKSNLNKIINEINELLGLVTEDESAVRTWRQTS